MNRKKSDYTWMDAWEHVGKPFFATCLIVYFLTFVAFEAACLFLQ